jgi:hypothetical protein
LRGEPTESFIHRHDVAHYRTPLKLGSLDEAQRRSIENLLSDEETRYEAARGTQN